MDPLGIICALTAQCAGCSIASYGTLIDMPGPGGHARVEDDTVTPAL